MQQNLTQIIKNYLSDQYGPSDVQISWSVPDESHGDLASNIALVIAKKLEVNPRKLAEDICNDILNQSISYVEKAEVAGPGFINITLTEKYFIQLTDEIISNSTYGASEIYSDKTVVTEFSDPNPFKQLHVGHLYTSMMGDAISRLISFSGGDVIRVNFGGDVGMHVAKAMWAIGKALDGFDPTKLSLINQKNHASWLSEQYVLGAEAFEKNDKAKTEIRELNKQIYQLHIEDDHDSDFAQVYWTTRQWSYDYFDDVYERIDVAFNVYMPESENAQRGIDLVRAHIGDVYEEDEGAIVFRGEKYDLHTRVFINSEGLPTYETKDVGVAAAKWNRYKFDESIIITGNEIIDYMKVVKKSMEPYLAEAVSKTRHLTHGIVKIKGLGRMSSRTGNVLSAEDVLSATKELIESNQENSSQSEQIMLAALRYSFLKQRMGDDLQFDIAESVKTVGNSGPYLQYALVRAKSILSKRDTATVKSLTNLETDERSVLRQLWLFPDVIFEATSNLEPHIVCTYLYETAQIFNQFYEQNQIIGHTREAERLQILQSYINVLENGFNVLGIPVLEQM